MYFPLGLPLPLPVPFTLFCDEIVGFRRPPRSLAGSGSESLAWLSIPTETLRTPIPADRDAPPFPTDEVLRFGVFRVGVPVVRLPTAGLYGWPAVDELGDL